MISRFLKLEVNVQKMIKKRLLSMDIKAINTLQKSRSELNRIISCKNAKDIWHALEVTYKGTNQVKESKINMLANQYELFKMFTRMTTITNSLGELGRTY